MPRARPSLWHVDTPFLWSGALVGKPALNRRLLQYWLENASHTMTLDSNNNPMSFPIIEQLFQSEPLLHALQSVSAAYELFYNPSSIHESLIERSKALQTMRQELQAQIIRPQTFLAVYILGVSSPWIDYTPFSFGQEHLLAARNILDQLLRQQDFVDHPHRPFIIGTFIWWDMSCSLLVSPAEQRPLDTPELSAAIASLHGKYCAMITHAIKLYYEIGRLGRYCRRLCEDQTEKDVSLEDEIELRLLTWEHSNEAEPFRILNETFRLHGFVLLYRLCKRGLKPGADADIESENYIRQCSLSILQNISEIKRDSYVFKFVHIPLLSAAAELTAEDKPLRERVIDWCTVIYSTIRSPTINFAVELLENHWEAKDSGCCGTWLDLMIEKGWRLSLG